jgi:hypothetical protein
MTTSPRSLSLVSRDLRTRGTAVRSFAPIKRSWAIVTSFRAWLAVRHGVRVDEFLRGRKGVHELNAAPDDAELPRIVDVSTGHVITRDNPRYVDPTTAAEPFEHSVIPSLRAMRSLPTFEPGALVMQRRIGECLARREEAGAALAVGREVEVPPEAPKPVHPSHEPRPLTPPILPLLASGFFAAAMMAFEGHQFALPFLNAIGVDSRSLSTEVYRATSLVISGFGFAFCLAIGLLIAAHMALTSVYELERGTWTLRLAASRLLRALVFGAVTVSSVWFAAATRHGMSAASSLFMGEGSGGSIDTTAFSVFGLLFALGAAVLSHIFLHHWKERVDTRKAQYLWDQARAAEAAQDRAHAEARAAALGAHQAELDRLTSWLGKAEAGMEDMIDEATTREQQVARDMLLREAYARAFVSSLASVLQVERAAFVRHASKRGRYELLVVTDATLLPVDGVADEVSGKHRIGV